jgi:hypothetical protein
MPKMRAIGVPVNDYFVEGKSIRLRSPDGPPARRNCVPEPALNRAPCTLC